MEKILCFDEVVAWALKHKEDVAHVRRVSVSEIKQYAKEVLKLAHDMFDYDAEFVCDKYTIKKYVKDNEPYLKYNVGDKTIRLKSFVKPEWLVKDSVEKNQTSLELYRALCDKQIAKKVFAEKEKTRE